MNDRGMFLESLAPLKANLQDTNEALQTVMQQAETRNPWFTTPFILTAIHAIADEFLDAEKCRQWLARYGKIPVREKRIGLVMAGNIPLVGFHDLFCVLASGHAAVVKLSDKDAVLIPFITDLWAEIYPDISTSIEYTERLQGIDAVIATGSNNSLRYFEYYFRKHPHIFRQNRNAVAVLTGHESASSLRQLATDIFMFFGLGCRNVSKLYVPAGYDFSGWKEAVEPWSHLELHNKYKHNLEYNHAIYIINQVPHIQLGHLILKEDEAIVSRIGSLHYSTYEDMQEVEKELGQHRQEIQCVISEKPICGWETILPGQSQQPALDQYADGVDTMAFLQNL